MQILAMWIRLPVNRVHDAWNNIHSILENNREGLWSDIVGSLNVTLWYYWYSFFTCLHALVIQAKIKLLNLHLHLLKKKYCQFWYHFLFDFYLKVFCSTQLWLSNNMPVKCYNNQQYKCNRSNTFPLEQAYSAVIAVAVGVWVRLQIRDECQIGQVWSVFLLPLSLSAQLFIMTDAAIDTGRQPLCSWSLTPELSADYTCSIYHI